MTTAELTMQRDNEQQAILNAMRQIGRPARVPEILQELEGVEISGRNRKKTVYNRINKLVHNGHIEKSHTGDGTFYVPRQGKTAAAPSRNQLKYSVLATLSGTSLDIVTLFERARKTFKSAITPQALRDAVDELIVEQRVAKQGLDYFILTPQHEAAPTQLPAVAPPPVRSPLDEAERHVKEWFIYTSHKDNVRAITELGAFLSALDAVRKHMKE